ncbi:MAG: hypothetical protein WCA55_12130, partial [Xanthobacteraceae bacterium]
LSAIRHFGATSSDWNAAGLGTKRGCQLSDRIGSPYRLRLYPFGQASLQCIAKLRNYGTANEQY